MPIAAGQSILKSQFLSALSLKQGAQTQITGMRLSLAIGSVVPMGLLPIPPAPIPLIPAGLSAGISMIQQAMSFKQGAQVKTTAQMIAKGVSLIAPLAPPAGLSLLSKQIEAAFSLKQGARENVVADLLSIAVITYYTCGGII